MDEIAIIGLGCRFPEARNPSEFWQILMEGKDVTSELTSEDLGRDPSIYLHPTLGTPDKISYTKNGYLRDFSFDPYGYKVHPERLSALDKLFHLPLYAANEALKDSGYWGKEAVLKRTGLILGNLSFATEFSSRLFSSMHLRVLEFYLRQLFARPDFHFADLLSVQDIALDNGTTASLPASIICSSLGLGGIRYALDAACATSLYVMQLAAAHLNAGQADMMLAGAVCCSERLNILHGFNVIHAFPGEGEQSIPLDSSSKGIKIGEGAGIFLLKRLADAQRDGDHIYAVIESIGLSNDGGGQHILTPSQKGQTLALERAYQQADPVDYIECHATGTPIGDRTELNSLEAFFANKSQIPLLGANKFHTGHMLTASAMASLIKVIWAMKEGVIPGTVGIQKAATSEGGAIGSAQIVREHTPWPQTNRPKRAGINAFGFGGTNAHLILREHVPSPSLPVAFKPQPDPLAIVGMHLHVGTTEGLAGFTQALAHNQHLKQPLGDLYWGGAEECLGESPPPAPYLEQFDLDCLAFKIPPTQVGPFLFDHLLMQKVADAALRDAGFSRDGTFSRTAVIVATEMNLMYHRGITRLNVPWYLQESLERCGIFLTQSQREKLESVLRASIAPDFYLEGVTGGIGNLAASRISALWQFTGPAFTLSAQENSVPQALEVAKLLLDFGIVDAVVVGAIDRAASWEPVQWRKKLYSHSPQLTFGDGAGAIVLKKAARARQQECKVYATLESLAIVPGNSDGETADRVRQAAEQALSAANLTPAEVGYLELAQTGIALLDRDEIAGLSQLYSLKQQPSGSVTANIGNCFVLSPLASLIKASVCLYHRFLPQRTWELSDGQPKRLVAVNGMSNNGSCTHLILAEADYQPLGKHNPQPNVVSRHGALVTLRSGTARMREIILTEENIEQLRRPQPLRKDKGLGVEARQAETVPILEGKLAVSSQQFLASARIESLFLQVQSAFYERLNRSLGQESLLKYPDKEKTEPTIDSPPSPPSPTAPLVWDLGQITEMVEGKISNVLGDYYAEMDSDPIRTRTPSPPFMLVSRVTKMTAKRGKLEPCMIEWEYDIPPDTIFASYNLLTALIPCEASHVLLLAMAYIGVDMMFGGKLRYRAIDTTAEFLGELPPPGVTIRGEVFIRKLIKTKKNLLLQYEYNCYYQDRQLLRITANSGYFSQADLLKSKGVPEFIVSKGQEFKQGFSPPLLCQKTQFSEADLQALQAGDFATCFGEAYRLNQPLPFALANPKVLLLDRILEIDRQGGPWGLGQILAEADIDPHHWVFDAHFKNDPVMPGTMLLEGCNRALLFYAYYLGLHAKFERFKPTWLTHVKSTARFRGEVKRETKQVQFRIKVKEINNADEPYLISVAEIISNGRILGICDDFAVKLVALQ